MQRLRWSAIGAVGALWIWSCGSSDSQRTAPEDAGADAGGAPDLGGDGGQSLGGHSGTANGGAAGTTTAPPGGAGAGEAGASPAAAGDNTGGDRGNVGGAPVAGAAGANDGGAPTLSCTVDPSLCKEGEICHEGSCQNVAGTLAGLLWELPCASDLGGNVCSTVPGTNVSTQLGGTAGITYDVKLHFRGVVEQKTYNGGCSDGSYWLTGGASNGDGYNVYRLTISSPPQTFYLNRGSSNITRSWALDFTQTIRIDAGATVTLFADTVDNQEIENKDAQNQPISVSNVSVAQPYNGQFIQMDVESVEADPVGSHDTVGGGSAGSALSFSGAQLATVTDAASLRVADVTQEGWFNFAAPSGVYSSLFGKPYGAASQDSYTIWFQGGALNAGVGASSPSGVPTVPWTTYNEWHHAALTYDAAAQVETLYVDGLPISCGVASGAVPYDDHPLLLGADMDNGAANGFFNGSLDELRLFSVARTPAQIWADMHTHQLGARTGLVAEWTFDEGSGQTTADSSGNSNSAVLGSTGAVEASDPTWVTSTVPY